MDSTQAIKSTHSPAEAESEADEFELADAGRVGADEVGGVGGFGAGSELDELATLAVGFGADVVAATFSAEGDELAGAGVPPFGADIGIGAVVDEDEAVDEVEGVGELAGGSPVAGGVLPAGDVAVGMLSSRDELRDDDSPSGDDEALPFGEKLDVGEFDAAPDAVSCDPRVGDVAPLAWAVARVAVSEAGVAGWGSEGWKLAEIT